MKNKNLLLIIALFFSTLIIYGQAPQRIDFQAMARDGSGNPMMNQNIAVKITVKEGATTVYAERHTLTTDEYGLFTLSIGEGAPISGSFAAIDWSLGNQRVKVEVDPNGGTSYVYMGTSDLASTPYAFYGEDDDADPVNELQTLSLSGNDLSISDGNTVTLPGGGSSLWTANGDDIYYNDGNVGIGTDIPLTPFHLYGGAGGGSSFSSIISGVIESPTWAYMEFSSDTWGGITFNSQNESVYAGLIYNFSDDRVMIRTGAQDDRLVIAQDGNVGINTTTPDAKLDVNGDVKLGASGVIFSELREITGTTDVSLYYTNVNLPSGYTEDNTRVLSLEINYNGDRWTGLANNNLSGSNNNVSYMLNGTLLIIYVPDMTIFKNRAFRILLMKVGTVKNTTTQTSESQGTTSSGVR